MEIILTDDFKERIEKCIKMSLEKYQDYPIQEQTNQLCRILFDGIQHDWWFI